jgi:hypothetical protein
MLNSPFAKLLVAIGSHLQLKVPQIKWIDQDFGQLENYKDGMRPAVNFPCVLIDFTGWDFEDLGRRCQLGQGQIIARVAYAPYNSSSSNTPTSQKEKALTAYEIEQKVFVALHGWVFEPFSALIRKSANTEKREDPIRVRELVFQSSLKDETGSAPRQAIARPKPTIGTDYDI